MRDVLRVSGLVTGYGDLKVLHDIDLTLYEGHVELLLGRNGAGKSTLVAAVAGLLPAWAGSIITGDHDISHLAPYDRVSEGIAAVLEGRKIFRRLSVRENLIIGGYVVGGSKRVLSERLDYVLEQIPDLRNMLARLAGSLSGGQQQMLAIGQALMPDPKILLLDEPSAGLAPILLDKIFQIIDQLRSQKRAILLVEQIVERALPVVDHVSVMDSGHIVVQGGPDMLQNRGLLESVYFGPTAT